LCREIGDAGRGDVREQKLQLEQGQALIADQGYAASATLLAFDRALELAEKIGDVSLQLPALWGRWAGYHITGRGSAELANRFAPLAEMQPESGPRLVGYRMLALELFFEGRFKDALRQSEKALETYDPALHRDLFRRFGHDPRTAAANYCA